MTINDQLRDIARRADQLQQVITAEEIVRRASSQDERPFTTGSRFNDDRTVVRYMPVQSTEEETTIIDLETPSHTDEHRKRTKRVLVGVLLAAAAVVAIAIVATRNDDPVSPADQPSPTSTAATTPPTATPPVLSDDETAQAILLSGDEYGPDWTRTPNGWILTTMDSTIADGIPECAPFVDSVFGAAEQGASAFQTFWHLAQPEAFSTQYVAVLPDATVARSVYELVNSPGFAPCASAYGTILSGGQSPGSFPSPVDQPITDPPFEPIGDLLTFRTFPHTWRTADGIEVGPQTDIDAVMLVGRTITFIGTVTEGEGGVVLNTTDQFRTALEHVVERASAAHA